MSILDESLIPAYPRAYTLWVNNYRAIEQEARTWYKQSTGRDPADSDLAHGLWRALNEGERWGTLRRAFQESWPLPSPSSLFIADGWDSGTGRMDWPMLLPGMSLDQQNAIITRMKANNRNTAVLLAVNPDMNNPPTYGPTIDVLLPTAAEKCRAAGLRVFYFLWSDEAERAWGNGRRHVEAMRDLLPAGSDVSLCPRFRRVEADEFFDDRTIEEITQFLSVRHRVWMHYTPQRIDPKPASAYGLAFQSDYNVPANVISSLAAAAQEWSPKPILFGEAQNLTPVQRWEVSQWGLRHGIGSLHAGHPNL